METTLGLVTPFSFGRGWPQLVPLAEPVAGVGVTFVVPGNRIIRPLIVSYLLVASAQEATRGPRISLLGPDGQRFYKSTSAGAVLKSTELYASFVVGLGVNTTSAAGTASLAMPELIMGTGMQISLEVGGMQTEDLIKEPRLYVEEFPAGRDGYPTGRYDVPLAYDIT